MVKYQEPKYEVTIMETNDIIAASNQVANIFRGKNDDGENIGEITVNAGDLFN